MDSDIQRLATQISDDIGYDLAERLRKFMDENDKNFTGKARESFFYNKYNMTVASSVPYTKVIDRGLPPNSDIEWSQLREWVKSSGKIDHDGDDKSIDRLTWKIYNKIKKDGIEPTYMVIRTLLAIRRGDNRAAV